MLMFRFAHCNHNFYCVIQVSKLLLAHRASVTSRDSDGQTPLHKAAASRSADVVRLLLDCPDADPCILDARGLTPLDVARASGGCEAALELLVVAEQALASK